MSGGAFEYNQYRISEIINGIETAIKNNNVEDEYGYCTNYSKDTIDKFKVAIKYLKQARGMAQRIDWLLSDDDGEETFHERWKEDKLNNK